MINRSPSRNTRAVGADIAFKLSRDFSALQCCTVPSTALRMSTAKMTMVLSALPESIEITAATTRMTTSRSLNCSKNTCHTGFFLSSRRVFGPFFSMRSWACWVVRPSSRLSMAWRTCCGV